MSLIDDEVVHPLEDPDYDPVHKPTQRKPIPDIVSRWNPASQVRWFERFNDELRAMRLAPVGKLFDSSPWYVDSVEHKGRCCGTCNNGEDAEYWDDPSCCCRSTLYSARLGQMGYTGWSKPPEAVTSHVPHLRCDNPVAVVVEGYSPRETYHGSLDRRIYACEEHIDLIKRKSLRGLNPFILRLPEFERRYKHCGKLTDYEGVTP